MVYAPEFWFAGPGDWRAAVLSPVGTIFAAGGRLRRALARPYRAGIPVICVGNLTAGGAGKTPVALDLGERLHRTGCRVAFVTRGYGGSLAGPVQVDPARQTAAEVGDEPLLLAAVAPTWVSRHRPAGIAAAEAAGAAAVVLDDGFQNPLFAKDLSLVVVDGRRGFGNGRVLPAGPLREPVASGLARADAIVLMGEVTADFRGGFGSLPVLRAKLEPDAAARALAGRRVMAFAGIGDPAKFFRLLAAIGCQVIAATAYPDHAPYRAETIRRHLAEAEAAGVDALVTTAKDAVRLPADLAAGVTVVQVRVAWDDPATLDALLSEAAADG